MKHLGNKAGQLKLAGKPTQFGIDRVDLLHVGAASPPVLRVRRYGAGLAFRGPWSGAQAAMHPAPVPVCDDGGSAGCALAGFGKAPLTRPMGAEPRCLARFDQFLMVN